MPTDQPTYKEDLDADVRNWLIEKKKFPQFQGLHLKSDYLYAFRTILNKRPKQQYLKTFEKFSQNPNSFGSSGTARGQRVLMTDGT